MKKPLGLRETSRAFRRGPEAGRSGSRSAAGDQDDATADVGKVPGDGPRTRAGLGDCPPGPAAAVPAKAILCLSGRRLEGDRRSDEGKGGKDPDSPSEPASLGRDRQERLDCGERCWAEANST
jgi:hypothetical protein